MAHLTISLLGPLELALDGAPLSRLKSVKARALLAYLATETVGGASHAPHPRKSLAALLWPEQLDADALHDLRQALSQLRAALGGGEAHPFLEVTPTTLALNPESDCRVDAQAFAQALATAKRHAHPRLEECPPACGGWRRRWPSTAASC